MSSAVAANSMYVGQLKGDGGTGLVWGLVNTSETVTVINENSSDAQVPSAKAVYDALSTVDNSVELTYAEYQALTDEKKNNGTEYYITDLSVNQKLETYSTEETIVGTWIDGKPIYRKVVDFGTLPNSTEKSVAHGIPMRNLLHVAGTAYAHSSGTTIRLPHIVTNSTSDIKIWGDHVNIYANTQSDRTGYTECYFIVEYTKTTD